MSNAPARKSQAIVSDGEGGFELVVTEVGEPRADEVLVHFADDFGPWCARQGFTFSLIEYRLDTSLRHPDGTPLTRDEIEPLIHRFIAEEIATAMREAGFVE